MRKTKKIVSVMLLLLILVSLPNFSVEAASKITVKLDGKALTFDTPPQLINGKTMVPMRGIFEALGASVQWQEETQTINATKGNIFISMQLNNTTMHRNNTTIKLDVPPQLKNGRTLVPVRAVAEGFGIVVGWEATSSTVLISSDATTVISPSVTPNSDKIIADLFKEKKSEVQVSGSGVVTKLLADDNEGGKHQRFILKLASEQTLLIAHNIDIAPRLDGVAVGDKVEFYGEYYYNDQGGGIHWTHHDPGGKHHEGYLKWDGKIFK